MYDIVQAKIVVRLSRHNYEFRYVRHQTACCLLLSHQYRDPRMAKVPREQHNLGGAAELLFQLGDRTLEADVSVGGHQGADEILIAAFRLFSLQNGAQVCNTLYCFGYNQALQPCSQAHSSLELWRRKQG